MSIKEDLAQLLYDIAELLYLDDKLNSSEDKAEEAKKALPTIGERWRQNQ